MSKVKKKDDLQEKFLVTFVFKDNQQLTADLTEKNAQSLLDSLDDYMGGDFLKAEGIRGDYFVSSLEIRAIFVGKNLEVVNTEGKESVLP